jgi:hypothetical protein
MRVADTPNFPPLHDFVRPSFYSDDSQFDKAVTPLKQAFQIQMGDRLLTS